jgi:hypothetical protein
VIILLRAVTLAIPFATILMVAWILFGDGSIWLMILVPPLGASPSRPLDHLYKVMLAPSGDIYAAGVASGPAQLSSKMGASSLWVDPIRCE